MLEENKELFDSFKRIHDNYALNPQAWQEKFNHEGRKILEVIRVYERKLCSHSEKGIYAKFSGNLAEKFKEETRLHFPKIDFVGIKIVRSKQKPDPFDNFKKIRF